MGKSFVLQALRVFSFEEMLKLSQSTQIKSVIMKKAAGAELIVWSDASEEVKPQPKDTEVKDNVLPFKKQLLFDPETTPQAEISEVSPPSEESKNFYSSEFMLWQRELSKEAPANHKKDAAQGYARSTEMYVVKSATFEGKEKIRFAATNGVLVNKKQA